MTPSSPVSSLAGSVGNLLERQTRRSSRQIGIVYVHHEIAAEQGDPDNDVIPALGAADFSAQLEHLGRHCEVVALAELPAKAAARRSGERIPAAITFDDDFANHASVAAPILERFGFPATFFLCGNTLDGPSSAWWQDLQTILDREPGGWPQLAAELAEQWPWAGLGASMRQFTLALETAQPQLRDALAAKLQEIAGPGPADAGLPAETVRDLAKRGFEIGFHTRHHYSLQALDDDQLDTAMTDGLEELADAAGYRPSTIAYPYGNADLRVAGAAAKAGFETGYLADHACAEAGQHPLLISRASGWTGTPAQFKWSLGRLARG